MNGRDSNTTLDESTGIQRLGVSATVGLILIGVVSVSSSFNAAGVLVRLAQCILGEWIVSRSYTVGVGIGILGIFPLSEKFPSTSGLSAVQQLWQVSSSTCSGHASTPYKNIERRPHNGLPNRNST